MNKFRLEIIVFICGAAVMILELVGSRIIAPYLGTSTFVWTSLIGIILGSMSLGYWLGGRTADYNPNYKTFSEIIFLAAIFIGLIIFIESGVLGFIQNNINDIRIGVIAATLALFTIPSILLGMISPYAVKLKINTLDKTGATVGNLYAISTLGSIIGTFAAGFVLIPYLGTMKILIFLSITLILTSFLAYFNHIPLGKIAVFVFFFSLIFLIDIYNTQLKRVGFIDVDTEYSRVIIYNSKYYKNNQPIRVMRINNEYSSAMFTNSNELVFEYTKYYRLAKHFKPDLKISLMIGGGGYSYPKDYIEKFPHAYIDVVEIDPKLTELARQYFGLRDNPRLKIYHEDGRTFLNKTKNKYDVIFGDAFKSFYALPYQLTTKEAVQKMYDALNNDGVALINIISAIEGEKGEFLRAEYATFKAVFPQVYLFPVENASDGFKVQNIMLVALKSTKEPSFKSEDAELNQYLEHRWNKEIKMDMPILTDDYAPVDYYITKLLL